MHRQAFETAQHDARLWLESLRAKWRERFASASEAERVVGRGCLLRLDGPVRIQAAVRVGKKVPVQVVVLRLHHADDDSIGVTVVGDHGVEGGDSGFDQCLLDVSAELYSSATRGWNVDRAVRPHRAGARRLDDGSLYEVIGELNDALLREIVDDCFRLASTAVTPSLPSPEIEHAYEMKLREPELVRRVLASRADVTLARLGLGDAVQQVARGVTAVGYWIGLFLPRRRLFGGDLDGDVDLIAGVNTVRLSRDRWERRVDDEVRALPMGMHRSNAVAIATMRACEEGLLVWPPEESYLVGAETKVSRFGPVETDPEWRWRGTRTHDGGSIAGQLRVHWAQGIARASYWHLGVTAPAPFFWPHLEVTSAAFDAFPEVDVGADHFGHLAEVVGAVTGRSEADAASYMTRFERTPDENPNWMATPWWRTFCAALGALPRPRCATFFVGVCDQCIAWFHSPVPKARCLECDPA